MIAYFVNYGFYFRKSAVQWRFPLLFQLIFAAYIVIVTPFLPDTPRWLMRHETSHERGLEVLGRLRNRPINDIAVQKEADGILEAIKLEAGQEGSWADLFRGNGIAADKRFYLALGIQFMQQMSGKPNINHLAFSMLIWIGINIVVCTGTILSVSLSSDSFPRTAVQAYIMTRSF